MNAQDLKNSILQLAIQGKLVEQRKEEGTAKELLEKIEAEKKQLIKEGKIKKQKELPEIKEDEIPFDIPESWEWVRLADVSENIHYGYTASANAIGDCKLLRITDIQNNSVQWESVPYCNVKEKDYFTYGLNNRDIMIARTGGTIGKTYIVENLNDRAVFASYLIRVIPVNKVDEIYLKKFMESPLYWIQLKAGSMGTGQPNVNGTTLSKVVLPLPPIEEQKRIVAKIEELMPYVDKYDVAYSEVEKLNKKFPEDMQKSILQYAIQGKLAEQREEDGTAEELYKQIQAEKEKLIREGKIKKSNPLPEIKEDEIPFDIPENWKWVRLGDLGSYRKGPFGSALTKAIFVPKSENTVKVYEQKNAIQKDVNLGEYYITREYFESKMKGFELFPGDIIVSCAGTIGETYIMPDQFEQGIINQALMQMKLTPSVNVEYFLLYFDFILKKTARQSSKGSAIKNIPPFEELKSYLVPIPPLAEQKRIIERIEELLPYTKQLAKKPD